MKASAKAYRNNLSIPQRQLFLLCSVSLVGGMLGSVALLYTSPDVFHSSNSVSIVASNAGVYLR
ncbi:hypothetical protein [Tolypothrix sp. VBCCA 56010]|uniref:hypothetical protein n=1 Tax=Tolypothrix sp. VBCCA 56010 TaxID=3137731 RepID=UPI003D7CE614